MLLAPKDVNNLFKVIIAASLASGRVKILCRSTFLHPETCDGAWVNVKLGRPLNWDTNFTKDITTIFLESPISPIQWDTNFHISNWDTNSPFVEFLKSPLNLPSFHITIQRRRLIPSCR